MTTPAETAEQLAAHFNATHPVGTPVLAYPLTRNDRALSTQTRSAAWVVSATPVVAVVGYTGGIALDHIDVLAAMRRDDQGLLELARHLEPELRDRLIALAAADARVHQVLDLEQQLQRAHDLERELRRILAVRDRQLEQARAEGLV